MANRYWVGGTGTWDASSTANWSTTSGGASGASVPTAADVAIFDQAATYTVTFSGTGSRTALAITNTAGTVTFAGTTAVALGGLTLEAVAVWSHTGALNFTVAGTHTLDTKNVTVSATTFSVGSTSWTLASDFRASGTVDLARGTLNLNGYTLNTTRITSTGISTRVLAFGAGQINITGDSGTPILFDATSQLTTTGSRRINLVSTKGSFEIVNVAVGICDINLYITQGFFISQLSGVSTVGTLDCTGYSGQIRGNLNVEGNLTLDAGTTWDGSTVTFRESGTKLITSNGASLPYMTINASGATVQLQDNLTTAFRTTLTAGTLNINGFTLTAESFDSSGSTGNFTRALAFGAGEIIINGGAINPVNFNTIISGLTMTGSKKIVLIDRLYTANPIVNNHGINLYVTAGAYPLDFYGTSLLGTLDCTGYTGQIQGSLSITGNLTLAAGTTWNGGTITFSGAGTKLVTTNGVVLPLVTVNASGGTVQLQDSLTATGTTTLSQGTLDLNGFTLTSDQFYADTGSAARTLAFGSTGQITVTGLVTNTIIDFVNSTYPSALTMTGSKRINIASTRPDVALAFLGPYEVDVYVPQGGYVLGFYGSSKVRNADFTGFTGSVGGAMNLTGNLTFDADMSVVGASLYLTTSGAGLQAITSNGRSVVANLTIIGTGTVQLQDEFTFTPDSFSYFEMRNGVLDLNGFAMGDVGRLLVVGYDYDDAPTTPELQMGSGSFRVIEQFGLIAGPLGEGYLIPTVTGPGTIEFFSDDDYYSGVIGGGGNDLLDPRVAVFPTVRHTGSNPLTVVGNSTFESFESLSTAGSVAFMQGNTNTFGLFNVSGAPGNLKTLTGASNFYIPEATQATLLKSTTWFVGANSVDDGNNTGLIFTAGGINDYLTISNIIGGGSGTTYATDVVEGVDLSDAAVAAEIKPTSVQEAVEAQDTTAVVVSDLVWSEFDDSQTPNWQNVDNTQVPTWTPVDDSQTPGWTPVTP